MWAGIHSHSPHLGVGVPMLRATGAQGFGVGEVRSERSTLLYSSYALLELGHPDHGNSLLGCGLLIYKLNTLAVGLNKCSYGLWLS